MFGNYGGEVLQVAPFLWLDQPQRPVVIGAFDAEVLTRAVCDLFLRPVRMHCSHDGDHPRDLVSLQCSVNSRWAVRRMMTGFVQITDAEDVDIGEPIQPL